MWYNVDFNKWAVQLLPPILRSKVLVVLLKIMLIPLVQLHAQFMRYRATIAGRLNVTASIQDIERILNTTFFLKDRQIYIEDINDDEKTNLYFSHEGQSGVFLNPLLTMWYPGEVPDKPNFIIYIPHFLCTSLNKAEDKYKGQFLTTIINLIDYYKPAGRRYAIRLYDYD